jgi:putative transposase
MARRHELPVDGNWRMHETYIEVTDACKHIYRAVDKQGRPAMAKRNMAAAKRFFDKVLGAKCDPKQVAICRRGANKAALNAINAGVIVMILVTPDLIHHEYHRTRPPRH